jgi:D-tagatose-1,6-bisphosphate aldolase subunit GatZ/KbaZ
VKALLDLVQRHRAGEPVGIYSVCSAHPLVLRAALTHAQAVGGYALIEATANQVNQFGGYTGLRPAAFCDLVRSLQDEMGLPRERVLLGGDHLGPTAWQSQPAAAALQAAAVMTAEYVSAGYRKIHLDCSMACADDPLALSEEIVAERAAELCAQAEDAWQRSGGEPPVYVIGTEVPIPGGATETLHELAVTEPQAALATVAAHGTAFRRRGLERAWERVIGLVVQPGVEFGHDRVVGYVPAKAQRLSACLEAVPRLVFEAHSTDYQTPQALHALVRDHFAILKVGPALTFAVREAIWALDQIEREWRGADRSSRVRETVLAAMRKNPAHWRKYYHGAEQVLDLQLASSLSDRIRYYWREPEVAAAIERLSAHFDSGSPPISLLRQYLPAAYEAVRSGELPVTVQHIVTHHVSQVLASYSAACNQQAARSGRGTTQ